MKMDKIGYITLNIEMISKETIYLNNLYIWPQSAALFLIDIKLWLLLLLTSI